MILQDLLHSQQLLNYRLRMTTFILCMFEGIWINSQMYIHRCRGIYVYLYRYLLKIPLKFSEILLLKVCTLHFSKGVGWVLEKWRVSAHAPSAFCDGPSSITNLRVCGLWEASLSDRGTVHYSPSEFKGPHLDPLFIGHKMTDFNQYGHNPGQTPSQLTTEVW